jgi:hypothetical protein
MRAVDGFSISNQGPGTYGPYQVVGGQYQWTTKSTGAGTIDLKVLAGDGSTQVAAATQVVATTGYQGNIFLAPGQVYIVIATFTANYVNVCRVPTE